jgi:Flp pilus assembly protein TadD
MRKSDAKPKTSRRLDGIICAFLFASAAVVYSRVLHTGFLNLDDPSYVVLNTSVHTAPNLSGIAYAFRAVQQGTWQPLVFLSFMFDWMLYGLNPLGYHLTNLLLHIATTLLLYYVFRRMTGSPWKSGVAAALFCLHPLHVESVAWVSERKDTLSAFFWVLTMLTYVHYTARPNIWRYALLALTFIAGLLSKSMLVTLPIVLLLMDYWPLGRMQKGLWKLVIEKLPLLGLVLVSVVITLITQHSAAATISLARFPIIPRFENVVVAYASYIGKMFWPLNLGVLYPLPLNHQLLPIWKVAGSVILLGGISIIVLRRKCSRGYLKFGWLWYIITLLPVIGIIQVGYQSMADRYTYIPLIGLFVMIVWGLPDAFASLHSIRKGSAYLPAITGVVLVATMACTWRQLGFWHDDVRLYEHTLSMTSGNWLLESSLGQELAADGRFAEAARHFREEIRSAPSIGSKGYGWLGLSLAKDGKYDESMKAYNMALRLSTPEERANMFPILQEALKTGLTVKAVKELSDESQFRTDPAQLHVTQAGALLDNDGDLDGAIEECNKALRINPRCATAYFELGVVMCRGQNTFGGYGYFNKAAECNPAYSAAYAQMARLDYERGDYVESWKHVHLCQRYGGKIPETAIAALKSVMTEPNP